MKLPARRHPMMRTGYLIGTTALVTSLAAGALIGYAMPAGASPNPDESTTPPATVVEGGETFVTNTGVDASWSAITSAISQKLPSGVFWPTDAPSFFDPSADGTKDLYEPGLFSTIAARFWRCAWLDADLDAQRSGSADLHDTAQSALADFGNVPGSDVILADGYISLVTTAAKDRGITPEQLEFSIDCGVYTEEGYAR